MARSSPVSLQVPGIAPSIPSEVSRSINLGMGESSRIEMRGGDSFFCHRENFGTRRSSRQKPYTDRSPLPWGTSGRVLRQAYCRCCSSSFNENNVRVGLWNPYVPDGASKRATTGNRLKTSRILCLKAGTASG